MVCMMCGLYGICGMYGMHGLHRHLVNVHDHTACAHCAEIVHNHARQKQHMNSDPNELQPATC